MMEGKYAIKVEKLSKRYTIGTKKADSFRQALGGIFRKKNNAKASFLAVDNLNFTINKGEVVGIIGKNGAGKSTLLKLLSQITKPTEGTIRINGRVASLLEVGTGFHPELTGRENIFLNGTILGMTRAEVSRKFDEIVAFSGVEKFIDTPVKHYSSGMYVRLAFSVAAHLEPEILIIDEVLAVGDAEFQQKCLGKMKSIAGEGRTVIFVSHNLAAVKELCQKGIVIEKGKLVFHGESSAAIQAYQLSHGSQSHYENKTVTTDKTAVKAIALCNQALQHCTEFTVNEPILIDIDLNIVSNSAEYAVFIQINDQFGSPVFVAEKQISNQKMTLEIAANFLTRGNYAMSCYIHIPRLERIETLDNCCQFNVTDATSSLVIHGNYNYGPVFGNFKWH